MNLGDEVQAWAKTEASVKALVLIGSRVRAAGDSVWRADSQSDWDFQIISSRPELFSDSAWTRALGGTLHTYAVRRAAIGGVPKAAVLFAQGEADFVILPARPLVFARVAVRLGLHRRSAVFRNRLQDLAVVIRPGWRFLKGRDTWEPLYTTIVKDVADPRLDDAEVRNLANSFVCDAVWTLRKIDRGEYLAAQRMVHRSLAETNFRLLHELKLRRGQRSFPEGRRAELILSERELLAIHVSVTPEAASLREAVENASVRCRELAQEIVGETWRWPRLTI